MTGASDSDVFSPRDMPSHDVKLARSTRFYSPRFSRLLAVVVQVLTLPEFDIQSFYVCKTDRGTYTKKSNEKKSWKRKTVKQASKKNKSLPLLEKQNMPRLSDPIQKDSSVFYFSHCFTSEKKGGGREKMYFLVDSFTTWSHLENGD